MGIARISVAEHPREASVARVHLDGLDITRDCVAASETDGWADCFVRDVNGKFQTNAARDGIKRERRHGLVVVDFPRGLD